MLTHEAVQISHGNFEVLFFILLGIIVDCPTGQMGGVLISSISWFTYLLIVYSFIHFCLHSKMILTDKFVGSCLNVWLLFALLITRKLSNQDFVVIIKNILYVCRYSTTQSWLFLTKLGVLKQNRFVPYVFISFRVFLNNWDMCNMGRLRSDAFNKAI